MNNLNQHYLISHAQNREDIILSGFFRDVSTGFYVDIGANDPAIDSVTKLFYEKGWNGINVEPIDQLYKKLVNSRPRDINLNIGISNKSGDMVFREYGKFHGLSTFSKDIYTDYDKLAKSSKDYDDFKEYSVKIKTLKQIFKENKVNVINFMKVDVEGYEYEVLKSNDWSVFRPQVICIEANHISKDWRPFLIKNKYTVVFFDGLNEYYVAEEAQTIKEKFSYIETMLPTPIIDYRVVGVIEHYKNEKLKADAQNVELSNQLYTLQHNLHVAQEELRELSRLKGLAKGIARKINTIVEEKILPTKYQGPALPVKSPNTNIVLMGSSPDEIFTSIKEYDNHALKKLNPPAHRIRYAVLKIHRKVVIKSVKKGVRLVKKSLKSIRER